MKSFISAGFWALCVLHPAQAAVVLPEGYGSLYAQAFDSKLGTDIKNADFPATELGVGISTADASLKVTPSSPSGPRISASADATGTTSQHAAGAYGSVGYYFTVSGPSDMVPVSIFAKGGTTTVHTGTGTNTTAASISIVGTIDGDIFGTISATVNQDQSFTLDRTVSLVTGQLYQVVMVVVAQADVFGGGSASGYASSYSYVDPVFAIADSVDNANDYSFAFSPGFSNGTFPTTVPLPSSILLFGAGLVGAGLWGRARRACSLRASADRQPCRICATISDGSSTSVFRADPAKFSMRR